jgi:hypothetical protein
MTDQKNNRQNADGLTESSSGQHEHEVSTQYTIDAGCSRWTNASRPMARHIKYAGLFLCGTQYRNGMLGLNEPLIEKNVTCKKCLTVLHRIAC